MNNTAASPVIEELIRRVVFTSELSCERSQIQAFCEIIGIPPLDCAAALLFLQKYPDFHTLNSRTSVATPTFCQTTLQIVPQTVKLIRYRLDIGRQHQVTPDQIKSVLVEESGVDRKNIAHIDIQESFTIIELPDEMPQDIFQLLKSVEINCRPLEIRRIKTRRTKRRSHLKSLNPKTANDRNNLKHR